MASPRAVDVRKPVVFLPVAQVVGGGVNLLVVGHAVAVVVGVRLHRRGRASLVHHERPGCVRMLHHGGVSGPGYDLGGEQVGEHGQRLVEETALVVAVRQRLGL